MDWIGASSGEQRDSTVAFTVEIDRNGAGCAVFEVSVTDYICFFFLIWKLNVCSSLMRMIIELYLQMEMAIMLIVLVPLQAWKTALFKVHSFATQHLQYLKQIGFFSTLPILRTMPFGGEI